MVHINVVMTAAGLVVFPVLAGIIGGVVAVLRPPGRRRPAFRGGRRDGRRRRRGTPAAAERGPLLIIVGFAAAWPSSSGCVTSTAARAVDARLPVGFLVVVGVDLFIDGLLVGTGAAVSTKTATIIAIALTVEVLFLGLSVALQLTKFRSVPTLAAAITALLSLAVAVGAILGALVLGDAGDAVLSLVLAFAAAALLWLVVEELLVEAHETPERPWMAAMFFVGFLALFCLEAIE